MNSKFILTSVLISIVSSAASLAAYHRFLRPMQRYGVIDVVDIYRIKEKEIVDLLAKPNSSEADKKRANDIAQDFAKKLPVALDELPHDCACMVFSRAAIAADGGYVLDLTPLLKSKLGM